MEKMKIYTQPGCNACIKAMEELERNGIEFEEKDVTEEFEKEFDDLTVIIGCWYTPTIVYKDNIIVGGRDFIDSLYLFYPTVQACIAHSL
jgi:glutaredoxin